MLVRIFKAGARGAFKQTFACLVSSELVPVVRSSRTASTRDDSLLGSSVTG